MTRSLFLFELSEILPFRSLLYWMLLWNIIRYVRFQMSSNIHCAFTAGDYNLLRDLLRVINKIIFVCFVFLSFLSLKFILFLFYFCVCVRNWYKLEHIICLWINTLKLELVFQAMNGVQRCYTFILNKIESNQNKIIHNHYGKI